MQLQEYLKQITPYSVNLIETPGKLYPIIVVKTPIGIRQFETVKEMWTGGLLSILLTSRQQVPKPVTEVLQDIRAFSDEATQALIADWHLNNN